MYFDYKKNFLGFDTFGSLYVIYVNSSCGHSFQYMCVNCKFDFKFLFPPVRQ